MSRDKKRKALEQKLKNQGYLDLNDGVMLELLSHPNIEKYLEDQYRKPNILAGLKERLRRLNE